MAKVRLLRGFIFGMLATLPRHSHGQLRHVFDSVEKLRGDRGDEEIVQLYCDPTSILVDWTFIGP